MVTVAYLGPPGTFTDAALHRLRADARASVLLADAEAVPAGTPDEALAMVRAGAADYACVPFENSVDGTVNPTSARRTHPGTLLGKGSRAPAGTFERTRRVPSGSARCFPLR